MDWHLFKKYQCKFKKISNKSYINKLFSGNPQFKRANLIFILMRERCLVKLYYHTKKKNFFLWILSFAKALKMHNFNSKEIPTLHIESFFYFAYNDCIQSITQITHNSVRAFSRFLEFWECAKAFWGWIPFLIGKKTVVNDEVTCWSGSGKEWTKRCE